MEIKGKRVLVVGLGKSGAAAAEFLQQHGARVTVSDSRTEAQLTALIPGLLDRGIGVETGQHGERTFRNQDLIVISPGVPVNMPQLVQARELGVEIIGEVELAYQFLQGQLIAITGSNGKTTTTTLIGEILEKSGRQTLVGGNIGTPVISFAGKSPANGWIVLEVSSFQLETIKEFHPRVAVLLNLTPDHLDRHGTLENYIAAKARIFENQGTNDSAVINADDSVCQRLAGEIRAKQLWFSQGDHKRDGAFTRDGQIVIRSDSRETALMPVSEIPLKGAHNVENVLAAICAATVAGCTADEIRRAVKEFKAVEHRLQLIATIDGIAYYNDSKATNVDATVKALEAFPGNIHLILGGKDKGSDYTALKPLLRQRAKHVYTIGAAAQKIESHIAGAAAITRAETLDRAVRRAAENAKPGDIVLLAPACASFDQFESYEHRGRVFREIVQQLATRSAAALQSTGDRT